MSFVLYLYISYLLLGGKEFATIGVTRALLGSNHVPGHEVGIAIS